MDEDWLYPLDAAVRSLSILSHTFLVCAHYIIIGLYLINFAVNILRFSDYKLIALAADYNQLLKSKQA